MARLIVFPEVALEGECFPGMPLAFTQEDFLVGIWLQV